MGRDRQGRQRLYVGPRRRFFYSLLAGTVLFCVVPVVAVVVYSSHYYTTQVVEEFRRGKQENLQAVVLENARLMQEFWVFIKFATDRDMSHFAVHNFDDDIVRFYRVVNRLTAHVSASQYLDSLHLYSGAFGYAISVGHTGDRFVRFSPQTAELSGGADATLQAALSESRFFTPFYRSGSEDDGGYLSYIVPILSRDRTHLTALVADIRLDSVINRIRQVSWDDGGNTYMILGESAVPLITNFSLPHEAVSSLLADGAASLTRAEGRSLIVTSAADGDNDLRFLSVVPILRVTRDLRLVLRTYYLTVVLLIMLFVAMAWIYTARLYRPVEQVLEVVSTNSATETNTGRTALQYIASEYQRVADENTDLVDRIASDRKIVRQHALEELLRGRVGANIQSTIPELRVGSRAVSYAVLIVHAEHDFSPSAGLPRVEGLQRALVEIVEDELDAQGVHGLVYALTNGEVAVIVAHESEQWDEMLPSFMQRIADHGSDTLEVEVHVGASATMAGLENISHGYRQAVEALRGGVVDIGVRVHSFTSMERQQSSRLESRRVVNKFAEVLTRSDDEGAVSHFALELVQDAQKQYSHHSDLQAYCIESIIDIMDYAERRSVSDAKQHLARFCEHLTACRTAGEIQNVICDTLTTITEKHRAVHYAHGTVEMNVARTISYVDEHYQENIGLEAVADAVGLNSSYLSRIFRRVTKLSFHEYLSQFRVAKARQLIETTNARVHEIGQTVGFGSALTFKRNFVKIEGCTPSEYRLRRGAGVRISDKARQQ